MYNVNWFLFRFSNYRLNSRQYVGSCNTVSARKACYNIGFFDILCAHSWNVTNCYSVNWCWIGIDGSSFGCSYCSICTVIGMFIVQSLLCLYYQFEYKKNVAFDLQNYIYRPLPLLLFGGVSFFAGLLALALPETFGEKLPDTVL